MLDEALPRPHRSKTLLTSEWKRAILITSVTILGICLLFSETISSMIVTWRSEPYGYGALILPISAWLVWAKRHQLGLLTPRPEFWVLLLVFSAGLIWLLANLVHSQFLQQFALISLLISVIWCILGTQVAKVLTFPLGILLAAAPPLFLIEQLYPTMMEFTADFTERLLRLTGVAVYRDGMNLSVPNGNWAVVEQCSGVQYLTASVIIGCVYAHYCFRSPLRRLLVLALAILVPVLANGLRAYIIILIGYLSDMKWAIGIDHLIFGLVFYFIIVYLMFFIGSYWWEPVTLPSEQKMSTTESGKAKSKSRIPLPLISASLASILAASIWPGLAAPLQRLEMPSQKLELKAPNNVDGWWREFNPQWLWSPQVHQADGRLNAFYRRGDQTVSLYLAQFRKQRRDAEPFGRPNVMIVREAQSWRNDIRSAKAIPLDKGHLKVLHAKTVTIMRGGQWGDLLVWYWYRMGNRYVTSPFHAKLLDAQALLTGGKRDMALIAMATTFDGDLEASENVLRSFASSMNAEIDTVLNRSLVMGK